MPFLDSLRDVLGGFADVKQIDKEGFDFREKRAQDEFERQRQRELAQQANEDRGLKMAEDVLAGSDEETPDVSPFLHTMSPEQRVPALQMLRGRARERKSALASQKAQTDFYLRSMSETGQDVRLDKRLGVTKSEGEAGRKSREQIAAEQQQAAMERVLKIIAGRQGGGQGGQGKWAWNTKENRAEFISPEALSTAPPGLYSDITTGRQGAASAKQVEATGLLIKNLDDALTNFEGTQQGLGRVTPAFLSPTKAVAWDRYKTALQSAGQMLGRKVLNDTRVSNEDRIAYANTIGVTSQVIAMLDPAEARRRLNLLKDLDQDYEAKYGGAGGGDSAEQPGVGGGPPQISSEAEYRALPSGTVYIDPTGKRRRKP